MTTDCPDCAGEGAVELERETGGVDANGPWVSIRTVWRECYSCNGSGEKDTGS